MVNVEQMAITEITQNQVKQRRILICSLQQQCSRVIRQTMILYQGWINFWINQDQLYQPKIRHGRRQTRQKDVKRNDIFSAWDHLWFYH